MRMIFVLRLRRPWTSLLLLFLLSLALTGCSHSDPVLEMDGQTMGTTYHIKLWGLPDGLEPQDLQQHIDERLEWVNDLMSTYRPQSELSRFNTSRSPDWFPVSPALASVVDEALQASRLSAGAFDITVGPAVNLWGFGPDKRPPEPPSDADIAAAKARIGYHKLHVRLDPPALRKDQADLYVDLSSIAKGYGVDQVADVLTGAGVQNFLVEIGGELRAMGTRPDGDSWRIAVERPVPIERAVYRIATLKNAAMATSGDYRNFFEWQGRMYSHTIDPTTGRPVTHHLASVTVIADTCEQADAWATMLDVLGPDKGHALAEAHDIAAFMIIRDGENDFHDQATSRFRAIEADATVTAHH